MNYYGIIENVKTYKIQRNYYTQDFQNIGKYMIKKSVISHIMYYYLFIFYYT